MANKPSYLNILSTILLVLGFVLAANWFGGVLISFLNGQPLSSGDIQWIGPEALKMKKVIIIGQIGGTVFGLILLPMLYVLLLRQDTALILLEQNWFKFGLFATIGVWLLLTILPCISLLGDWNKALVLPESLKSLEQGMRSMEEKATAMTKLIVYSSSNTELLFTLFTVALLPAISEELVFRGILQNEIFQSTGSIWSAIILSSLVFSFIHFQFFGFFPRFVLGMVLGYAYFTSGNILVSMLMHFTNNALVVIVMNLHNKGTITLDPESAKDIPLESILISTMLSGVLFYLCWRFYQERVTHQ